MDVGDADAERLRDFNRFYTQTIGVLTDRYLGQRRPLGEARLLFEIGADGADVRELRARLQLDSGYVSRLLRALESAKLARTRPSPADNRVRLVDLTPAGISELDELNRRATQVATGLLDPLDVEQRASLMAALDVIRRRLRCSAVRFAMVDPDCAEARACLRAYAAELAQRFPEGYDEHDLISSEAARGKAGALVLARENGRAIGCGVLRTSTPGIAEIRHLWIDPAARGVGFGHRLLSELEREAAARCNRVVRLDTHRVLTEAIALYRASAYHEVPAYDGNPHAHLWFEKSLRTRRAVEQTGDRERPFEGGSSADC